MRISPRARAPSHAPEAHAIWTFPALKDELQYLFVDVFPKTPHEGIGGLPGELFDRSVRDQGMRPARFIAFDDAFRAMTMPLFPRKVKVRYEKGIRVDYFWYWCDEFLRWRDKKVTVRIEPEDDFVMVLLGNKWHRAECRSAVIRSLSNRDLQVHIEEFKAELRKTNRDKRINPIELESFIARVRRRELDLRAAKQAAQAAAAKPASNAEGDPAVAQEAPPLPSANEPDFKDIDFSPAPTVKVKR